MPAPLLPQGTLDYTGLARLEMLSRLQTLFNQVNPEYDDFSAGHPENLLLEGMVFVADTIRSTMEERVRQLNWATITDRLAAIRLGRLSGFQLPGGSPATLTGIISLRSGTAAANIHVPDGLRIRTREQSTTKAYRVTTTDIVIPMGSTPAYQVQVGAEQAEIVTEAFDSPLEPNMELMLGRGPYVDGSATVSANDGAYAEYQSFLGVSSTTRAFVVFVDEGGIARIRFGNGLNGSIPQGSITVDYKIGGGVANEVSANAVWQIDDAVSDDLGNPVNLVFTNPNSSLPAMDAMTVAEARVRGPRSLATRERLVEEDDFEYAATNVSGIARALMATSDTTSVVAEDAGRLVVVAYGTRLASGRYPVAVPSDAKLEEVAQAVAKTSSKPPVMGFVVTAAAAPLKEVHVAVHIHKTATATATATAANIRAALADFFAVALADKTPNLAIDFGARLLSSNGSSDYLILWSAIFDAILTAQGVRYIPPTTNNLLLNGAHNSVMLQPLEFPKLGTVIIYDEDAGGVQI